MQRASQAWMRNWGSDISVLNGPEPAAAVDQEQLPSLTASLISLLIECGYTSADKDALEIIVEVLHNGK